MIRLGDSEQHIEYSSSVLMQHVVAVDVLIDISTLRALVATGGANAKLYFLDSVGSETLP